MHFNETDWNAFNARKAWHGETDPIKAVDSNHVKLYYRLMSRVTWLNSRKMLRITMKVYTQQNARPTDRPASCQSSFHPSFLLTFSLRLSEMRPSNHIFCANWIFSSHHVPTIASLYWMRKRFWKGKFMTSIWDVFVLNCTSTSHYFPSPDKDREIEFSLWFMTLLFVSRMFL